MWRTLLLGKLRYKMRGNACLKEISRSSEGANYSTRSLKQQGLMQTTLHDKIGNIHKQDPLGNDHCET